MFSIRVFLQRPCSVLNILAYVIIIGTLMRAVQSLEPHYMAQMLLGCGMEWNLSKQ